MNKLISLFVCFLFVFSNAYSQKSALFNGKPYLIYPQKIDAYGSFLNFDLSTLQFKGLKLPPLIGSIPDGEYLIYNKNTKLVNKRKVSGFNFYDTIPKVYATFTIKNNKKEGPAYLYKMEDQKAIYVVLPYKNDMLDGHIVFTNTKIITKRRNYYDYSEEYDEEYYETYDFSPYSRIYNDNLASLESFDDFKFDIFNSYKGKFKIRGKKFDLNYKEGLLDGKVLIYKFSKKDTLLSDSFTVDKGLREGLFNHYYYDAYKGKLKRYSILSGNYKKGQKEGKWTLNSSYYNDAYYFSEGSLGLLEVLSNGKIYKQIRYGKDSILKYYPDYKKEVLFPDIKFNQYVENKEMRNLLVTYYTDNKLTNYTFSIDGMIRINYYKLDQSFSVIQDTIINGKFFRKTKSYYGRNENYYLHDTCFNSTYENGYCAKLIWSKSYNHKGILIKDIKYPLYYELMKDSGRNILQSHEANKHCTQDHYFNPDLNYYFTNSSFKKGSFLNGRVYYKVSGNLRTGEIIKYIKIPVSYDTLTLIDTLMLKGKWNYNETEYFTDAFGKLTPINNLQTKYRRNSSNLSIDIYNFLQIKPKQHKAVFWGRTIFTGYINLKIKYKRNWDKMKTAMYEYIEFFGISKRKEIDIHIVLDKQNKRKRLSQSIIPEKLIQVHFEDGVFSGSVNATSVLDGHAYSSYYSSNNLSSNLSYSIYSSTYSKRYREKLKYKKLVISSSSSISYSWGLKNGQWSIKTLNYEGNYLLTFHNDKLNGKQYRFNRPFSDYMDYIFTMKNDTLDGDALVLNKNGYPTYKGYFRNGLAEGEFIQYFSFGDTTNNVKQRFYCKQGVLDGLYTSYREKKTLKTTIKFELKDSNLVEMTNPKDKNRYRELGEFQYEKSSIYGRARPANGNPDYTSISGYDAIIRLFAKSNFKRAYFTHYYKGGDVFKRGYKEYLKPVGKWYFYREGKDRLYKTIDFNDSLLRIDGKDSVFSYGIVKAYYEDGKPMFVGLATDFDTKYSCESEAEIPVEQDIYLEFFDTAGVSILKNGSGFIEEYQANGYKLREGQVVNYKKQGVWIFYNTFGQAEAIGFYENGKKTGRWLTGDLSGIKLSDKLCFMSNEEFLYYINTSGKFLDLNEEYYNDGILVSKNRVNTINK